MHPHHNVTIFLGGLDLESKTRFIQLVTLLQVFLFPRTGHLGLLYSRAGILIIFLLTLELGL